jgi:CRP-like cAMP-binding protein
MQTEQTSTAMRRGENTHNINQDLVTPKQELAPGRSPSKPAQQADTACFREGAWVFKSGQKANAVYQVLSGAVLLTRPTDEGNEQVLEALGERAIVGVTTLAAYEFGAMAMTRAIVRRIPISAIQESIEAQQLISAQLATSLARIRDQVAFRGRKAAPRLVASALLSLPACATIRSTEDSRRVLHTRVMMTEPELSSYLGLTRQTVGRVLANLKADGLIRLASPRLLVIRDLPALELIASGEKYRAHPESFYEE